MNTITYTPLAGESIEDTTRKALDLAQNESCIVEFTHNDIPMSVHPMEQFDELVREWHKKREEEIQRQKIGVANWWKCGWNRAWQKRKYPQNIKPFGRAWTAGLRRIKLQPTP